MTSFKYVEGSPCDWDVSNWRSFWFDLYRLWYCVQTEQIEDIKTFGLLAYAWHSTQKFLYEYFRYSLIEGIVWFE